MAKFGIYTVINQAVHNLTNILLLLINVVVIILREIAITESTHGPKVGLIAAQPQLPIYFIFIQPMEK